MSKRSFSPKLAEHLDRPDAVRVFDMLFLDLETRPLHVHNDLGTIRWNGHDWLSVGDLGRVSEVVEDGLIAPGLTSVELNGVKPEWLADARSERHIGRTAIRYIAARNFITGELDGDPHLWTRGTMQAMSIVADSADAAISLRIEDARANFRRSPGEWFSNDQQQQQHPGDKFFSFLSKAAKIQIQWGERGIDPFGPQPGSQFGYGFHGGFPR